MENNITIKAVLEGIDQNIELVRLHGDVQAAIGMLNMALASDVHSNITARTVDAKEAAEAYNEKRTSLIYEAIMQNNTPMLMALTMGYIDLIGLSSPKADKGSDILYVETTKKSEVIDLVDIENNHRMISNNGQWRYWVEKFTFNMSARAAQDMGYDADRFAKAYRMSGVAKNCDIGATPSSITQMAEQLQAIADAILYADNGSGKNAYKVIKTDVHYILYVMCNRKGALTVSMPRETTMRKLITEVMHRIVTKGRYDLDYEVLKKKG